MAHRHCAILITTCTICALVGCRRSNPTTVAPSSSSASLAVPASAEGGQLALSAAPDFASCLQGAGDPRCLSAARANTATLAGAATVSAPGGFIASAVGGSVTLRWTAPSSGDAVTAYNIEAGSAAGLANLANFSTGNTPTTYAASGVGAGTYYVRVRAVSGAAVSAPSNEAVLVVSETCAVPGPPGSFTLTTNRGGTLGFSWTAPSVAPTTYIIEAGSSAGLADLANSDLGSVATTFTTTGVGVGVYYVRLRSKNACGTSGPSNEVVVTVEATVASDLVFMPDAGFRQESASIPAAGVDPSGTVFLYYVDNITNETMAATAADGLNFGLSTGANPCCSSHANDSRRTELPDHTWRYYSFDQPLGVMTSMQSTDGIFFQRETGIRYTPVADDYGWIGVFDAYTEGPRVILLYLGHLDAPNNLRSAISMDNGVTFTLDQLHVLGDAGLSGHYVDPKTIKLPDGRRRLFMMKDNGKEIDSFISSDGLAYTLETGTRLALADFTSTPIRSLNDPVVVRLLDGRYRMYVAALVTSTGHFAIVSATTSSGSSLTARPHSFPVAPRGFVPDINGLPPVGQPVLGVPSGTQPSPQRKERDGKSAREGRGAQERRER